MINFINMFHIFIYYMMSCLQILYDVIYIIISIMWKLTQIILPGNAWACTAPRPSKQGLQRCLEPETTRDLDLDREPWKSFLRESFVIFHNSLSVKLFKVKYSQISVKILWKQRNPVRRPRQLPRVKKKQFLEQF